MTSFAQKNSSGYCTWNHDFLLAPPPRPEDRICKDMGGVGEKGSAEELILHFLMYFWRIFDRKNDKTNE